MLDRGQFWSPALTQGPGLQGKDLQVRLLLPIGQIMISGDLDAGLARFGLGGSVGLLGAVSGERYALRLARGRALVVGADIDASQAGWREGVAITPMTGALAVIEMRGPQAMELVARATAIDLRKASPCAALSFAGVTSVLCSHQDGLRLHLDRGLVTYMFDWMGSSGLF